MALKYCIHAFIVNKFEQTWRPRKETLTGAERQPLERVQSAQCTRQTHSTRAAVKVMAAPRAALQIFKSVPAQGQQRTAN